MRKFSLLIIGLIMASCSVEDPYSYCGAQIVEKGRPTVGGYFKLRIDGEISNRVYVLQYDYESFSLGDTIKCK